ncbi:MAG: peptidylprolyl isomerase [Rikenellaceae bacterium]
MIKGFKYLLLTLSIASTTLLIAQQRVVLEKVVAVVGGSSVLKSEVDDYVRQLEEYAVMQGYTSDRDPLSEAVEELMTQRLLYTQALIDSVEVDNSMITSQVDQQINAMIEAAGGIGELERAQNMEVFNIRQILYNRIKERSYAENMRSEIVSRVTITPGEVERFYKDLNRDEVPTIGDQYRYSQITRFPESMEEAKRRVREELLDMRERIITGTAQFSSLAQMYSVDPGSAYRGGMMEPQPANAFTEPFANALEALQEGQVSEVVESEFGLHIIELLEKRGNLYSCRHILLRPNYTTDELMEPIYFLDSLAKEIRNDEISFAQAARDYSDDATSKMNGGVVTNQDLMELYNATEARLTVTKFSKEDFGTRGRKSLDDYVQLSKLKVGEVSDPFTTQDMLGNQLTKIIKLEELYPAHKASLSEDYLQLEAMALSAKQLKVFNEWLNKHIRSTYITVNKDYQKLEFNNTNWIK